MDLKEGTGMPNQHPNFHLPLGKEFLGNFYAVAVLIGSELPCEPFFECFTTSGQKLSKFGWQKWNSEIKSWSRRHRSSICRIRCRLHTYGRQIQEIEMAPYLHASPYISSCSHSRSSLSFVVLFVCTVHHQILRIIQVNRSLLNSQVSKTTTFCVLAIHVMNTHLTICLPHPSFCQRTLVASNSKEMWAYNTHELRSYHLMPL